MKLSEAKCKFLTKVLGECWHDLKPNPKSVCQAICKKCKKVFKVVDRETVYRTFDNPTDMYDLLQVCKTKDWWRKFLMDKWGMVNPLNSYINIDLIDKDIFPNKVAEFLGFKEN